MLRGLLWATLVLMIASTPFARKGLEASLTLAAPSPDTMIPAFIFILAGGYVPGVTPAEDILVTETQRRVLHGVTLWRRYPKARLVFAGAAYDHEDTRGVDRMAQLMAVMALNTGVPASAALLEPRSRNTREHALEALRLPGVTPDTPIAVVTSGVHTRRARREFARYFRRVQTHPVPSVPRPLGWNDFIPDAGVLGGSTVLLQEWVGMFWYAVLAARSSSRVPSTPAGARLQRAGPPGA